MGTASLAPPLLPPQIPAALPSALTTKTLSPDIAMCSKAAKSRLARTTGRRASLQQIVFLCLLFPMEKHWQTSSPSPVPCRAVISSGCALLCGVPELVPGLPTALLPMAMLWSQVLAPRHGAAMSTEVLCPWNSLGWDGGPAVVIVTDIATWPDGDTWRKH